MAFYLSFELKNNHYFRISSSPFSVSPKSYVSDSQDSHWRSVPLGGNQKKTAAGDSIWVGIIYMSELIISCYHSSHKWTFRFIFLCFEYKFNIVSSSYLRDPPICKGWLYQPFLYCRFRVVVADLGTAGCPVFLVFRNGF